MTGLTELEVQSRIKAGLTNKSQEESSIPILSVFMQNILELSNLVIFICIGILIAYGQKQEALMSSIIILMNVSISVYQELRARRKLKKLRLLRTDKVMVIRDNKDVEVEISEIVMDDLIRLSSGQFVYVDGELLENDHLLVDEANLTGESDYMRKNVGDGLLSGTFVTGGKGIYKATKVGKESTINQITKEAKKYVNVVSPLQKSVNDISKTMLALTGFSLALLFVTNMVFTDMERLGIVNASISIVSALIPQGVIMTVTLSLTLGTIRMAQKNILVQKLTGVESLAGIKVLCMDKTGTLTENKLKLINYKNLSDTQNAQVEGIIANYCKETLEKNKTIRALSEQFAWGENMGEFKVLDEMPFNSKIKQSGIEAEYKSEKIRIILGSFESVLERFAGSVDTKPLAEINKEYANKGFRNLYMIYKKTGKSRDNEAESLGESGDRDYIPLAFFSLEDKLRENAGEIISGFVAQGVKPVIISGDNPNTLVALMERLEIPDLNKAITGAELETFSTDKNEFHQVVISHNIFARVSPAQKVQIIKEYQKEYTFVGMIGDGVNDALAIKQANIGIALGSGADAAKNISDVVLLDDSLISLNEVIIEGRRILYNTRRGAQLIIGKNFFSMVIIISALLLNLIFPFNPRSLFVLGFFNGSITMMAILADKSSPAIKTLFGRKLYHFAIPVGLIGGIIGVVILIFSQQILFSQTLLLTFLILVGQYNYIFSLNDEYVGLRIKNVKRSSIIVVFLMAFYILIMYTPALGNLFLINPLNTNQWMIAILGLLGYIVIFNATYFLTGKLKIFDKKV